MYYRDHEPPHFRAAYGEFEITVEIKTGIVKGEFPRRALRHVLEWLEMHEQELSDNWTRAANRRSLRPIPPLE